MHSKTIQIKEVQSVSRAMPSRGEDHLKVLLAPRDRSLCACEQCTDYYSVSTGSFSMENCGETHTSAIHDFVLFDESSLHENDEIPSSAFFGITPPPTMGISTYCSPQGLAQSEQGTFIPQESTLNFLPFEHNAFRRDIFPREASQISRTGQHE